MGKRPLSSWSISRWFFQGPPALWVYAEVSHFPLHVCQSPLKITPGASEWTCKQCEHSQGRLCTALSLSTKQSLECSAYGWILRTTKMWLLPIHLKKSQTVLEGLWKMRQFIRWFNILKLHLSNLNNIFFSGSLLSPRLCPGFTMTIQKSTNISSYSSRQSCRSTPYKRCGFLLLL